MRKIFFTLLLLSTISAWLCADIDIKSNPSATTAAIAATTNAAVVDAAARDVVISNAVIVDAASRDIAATNAAIVNAAARDVVISNAVVVDVQARIDGGTNGCLQSGENIPLGANRITATGSNFFFTFEGDTDSGIFYNPATHRIEFKWNGVNGHIFDIDSKSYTAGSDVGVTSNLYVSGYSRIDGLRVGTTSTTPGDGNLYVEKDISNTSNIVMRGSLRLLKPILLQTTTNGVMITGGTYNAADITSVFVKESDNYSGSGYASWTNTISGTLLRMHYISAGVSYYIQGGGDMGNPSAGFKNYLSSQLGSYTALGGAYAGAPVATYSITTNVLPSVVTNTINTTSAGQLQLNGEDIEDFNATTNAAVVDAQTRIDSALGIKPYAYIAATNVAGTTYATTTTYQHLGGFVVYATNTVLCTSSNMTIQSAGVYDVGFQICGTGEATAPQYAMCVHTNNHETTIRVRRDTGSTAAGSASSLGILVLQVGDIVDLRIKSDGENDYDVVGNQFRITKLGD